MSKSKRKMRRKPEGEKRTAGIRALLPVDLEKRLRARAKAENRSLSTMIMVLIERGLRDGG
jgi:CopG-like RHH_1 or ribbon-helix-helix domain, RHH_5